MREITEKIYKYEELSEEAKEKARHERYDYDYFYYGEDLINSLGAFERVFPIEIESWEYGMCGCYVSYKILLDGCDDYEFYEEEELKKYLLEYYDTYCEDISENCCSLTGVCSDYALLETLYEFIKEPYDCNFKELLEECIANFEKVVEEKYEYWLSEEIFIETCECNDIEFYEDGSRYC